MSAIRAPHYARQVEEATIGLDIQKGNPRSWQKLINPKKLNNVQ